MTKKYYCGACGRRSDGIESLVMIHTLMPDIDGKLQCLRCGTELDPRAARTGPKDRVIIPPVSTQ